MNRWCVLACGAALAALPATAEPAAPNPGPAAELLIRLAVAEARCTGSHQKMVARYRPVLLRDHAAQLRAVGQHMAERYRAAHGEDWQAALEADMTTIRTRFAQEPDQARFCKAAALQARAIAGDTESSADRFRDPRAVENDLVRLADRVR